MYSVGKRVNVFHCVNTTQITGKDKKTLCAVVSHSDKHCRSSSLVTDQRQFDSVAEDVFKQENFITSHTDGRPWPNCSFTNDTQSPKRGKRDLVAEYNLKDFPEFYWCGVDRCDEAQLVVSRRCTVPHWASGLTAWQPPHMPLLCPHIEVLPGKSETRKKKSADAATDLSHVRISPCTCLAHLCYYG